MSPKQKMSRDKSHYAAEKPRAAEKVRPKVNSRLPQLIHYVRLFALHFTQKHHVFLSMRMFYVETFLKYYKNFFASKPYS